MCKPKEWELAAQAGRLVRVGGFGNADEGVAGMDYCDLDMDMDIEMEVWWTRLSTKDIISRLTWSRFYVAGYVLSRV